MEETTCIGFIGLGLIGGSLAKAIHKKQPDWKIIAYDINTENTKNAYREGTIQAICSDVNQSYTRCDYIFLCAPVSVNIRYMELLKQIKKPECILTDVGSVKSDIHIAVSELELEDSFIGGHPMTGSEKTGYHNSNDHLLENAYYIITPGEQLSVTSLSEFSSLISSLGAIPMILTSEEHDYITAAISHLPHVIAASLVNLVQELDNEDEHMKQIAAGGFKDITRIASSSPVMWEQICLTNSNNISKVLDAYIRSLIQFRVEIDNQDQENILKRFADSKAYRNSLPDTAYGPIKKVHEIYCDIADETGGIAAIATLLASNNINLKNIGIINNREFEKGVLRIEFYLEEACRKAVLVLQARNYTVYER